MNTPFILRVKAINSNLTLLATLSMLFTWFNVNYVIFSVLRKPNVAWKTVLMNTDALYSGPLVVISRPHSQNTFLATTIHTVHMLLIPIEKLINQHDSIFYWWMLVLASQNIIKRYIFVLFYESCSRLLDFKNILKSILTYHDLLWSNAVQDLSSTAFCNVLKSQLHYESKFISTDDVRFAFD